MRMRSLDSGWTCRSGEPGPGYERPQLLPVLPNRASVPGCIHLDLMANGVIPDPFKGRFESGLAWVDESAWIYDCEFEWQPDPEAPLRLLRFEGLDTICTIELNGERIGESDNFFVPLEIDVTDRLEPGANRLTVAFNSAVREGMRRRAAYFAANGIRAETRIFDERAFIRKPAYQSGWDWGPRLVSCGIWQPIQLLEFRARIARASAPCQALGGGRFLLQPGCEVEGDARLTVSYNGRPFDRAIEVRDDLWWPNGEGAPSLQEVRFELDTGDSVTRKIGLRTIELVRQPDEFGTSFEFVVNGRRVWCRGANWIPHDAFPSRADLDAPAAVARYAALGMNMLRVWGGGMYESEAFYDACDENGIMVWQDFPYACSYYPDDEAAKAVAASEAADHVKRLRDRASLAIWCGNNENRSMWHSKWGGADHAPERFYGEPIYDDVLKSVVEEFDPGRPYVESSPLLVAGMVDDAPSHSDDHYWDVWHGRGDWVHYRESTARFSSEFGFASSCSALAWIQAGVAGGAAPDDPVVRAHDKSGKPWDTFQGMVELHYPQSETLADWTYHSQLNQRDAMREAVEHYRCGERCRGALIWQANDCWPAQSWALEDYARNLKPAGFELKRLYAPVLLVPRIAAETASAILVNDSPDAIEATVRIEAVEISTGAILESVVARVGAETGERSPVTGLNVGAFARTEVALRFATDHTSSDRWALLCEPKELRLVPQPIVARQREGGVEINVPGFVMDLVFRPLSACPNSPSEPVPWPGFGAWTGLDLTLPIPAISRNSLAVRSLAGFHEIVDG